MWALAAKVFGGLIGGVIIHELAHYAVAWLLGARPSLGMDGLRPVTRFDDPGSALATRAILLAPLASGVAAGGGYYILRGVPPDEWLLPGVLAWVMWTFQGGAEDYSLRAARGEDWWWTGLDDHERLVYAAFGLAVVGLALLYWPASSERLGYALRYVGQGVFAATVFVFLYAGAVKSKEPHMDGR